MNSPSCWLVELELERIQTYLYAVPNLKTAIGANAKLGEIVRGVLGGSMEIPVVASKLSLLQTAWDCAGQQSAFPEDRHPLKGKKAFGDCNNVDAPAKEQIEAARDIPFYLAVQTGVLSRDGGHFDVIFAARDKAVNFIRAARLLLARELPGVTAAARLFPLTRSAENGRAAEWKKPESPEASETDGVEETLDLPQAQVCEISGTEVASEEHEIEEDHLLAGATTMMKINAGRRFDQGETKDILGLLQPHLRKQLDLQNVQTQIFPNEFRELAVKGYIAVVHIDGNGVGSRAKNAAKHGDRDDYFEGWCERERFFWTMRVGFRSAFCAALAAVFKNAQETPRNKNGQPVVRPLMLGGDDLTLVCGAPYALPFVRAFARELDRATRNLEGGRLTISAGVAIVGEKFPFHRAYGLAEQLTESGKHLAKRNKDQFVHAVDWEIVKETWHDDIAATRRAQCRVNDADGQLLLTAKPYPVLTTDAAGNIRVLDRLLDDAERVAGRRSPTSAERSEGAPDSLARGQFARLVEHARRGRHSARFAAEMLPHNQRAVLGKLGYLDAKNEPWFPLGKSGFRVTYLLDLLELYELREMALAARAKIQRAAAPMTDQGAAHA